MPLKKSPHPELRAGTRPAAVEPDHRRPLAPHSESLSDLPGRCVLPSGQRLTWAQLSDEATAWHEALVARHSAATASAVVHHCIEWITMHMAAPAGAALVNVNPAYRSHELQYTLKKSRMKALFLWHKDKRPTTRRSSPRPPRLDLELITPSTSIRPSGPR